MLQLKILSLHPTANYSFASATMTTTSGEKSLTDNLNLEQMITGDIVFEGNVITTNVSDPDLDFRANGTGTVDIQANVDVGLKYR